MSNGYVPLVDSHHRWSADPGGSQHHPRGGPCQEGEHLCLRCEYLLLLTLCVCVYVCVYMCVCMCVCDCVCDFVCV